MRPGQNRSAGWLRLIALCSMLTACGGNDEPANAPPAPVIASPASGATFKAGDTLTFAGSASDAEDGSLPATNLT